MRLQQFAFQVFGFLFVYDIPISLLVLWGVTTSARVPSCKFQRGKISEKQSPQTRMLLTSKALIMSSSKHRSSISSVVEQQNCVAIDSYSFAASAGFAPSEATGASSSSSSPTGAAACSSCEPKIIRIHLQSRLTTHTHTLLFNMSIHMQPRLNMHGCQQ